MPIIWSRLKNSSQFFMMVSQSVSQSADLIVHTSIVLTGSFCVFRLHHVCSEKTINYPFNVLQHMFVLTLRSAFCNLLSLVLWTLDRFHPFNYLLRDRNCIVCGPSRPP